MEYGESFLKWMSENQERWGEFLTQKELPKNPAYEKVRSPDYLRFLEAPENLAFLV